MICRLEYMETFDFNDFHKLPGVVPEGETTPVYDEYPIVINPDYDPSINVLVVQDGSLGKYLGHLVVEFDENGHITHWDGNPDLLDAKVEEGKKRRVKNISEQVIVLCEVILVRLKNAHHAQCMSLFTDFLQKFGGA